MTGSATVFAEGYIGASIREGIAFNCQVPRQVEVLRDTADTKIDLVQFLFHYEGQGRMSGEVLPRDLLIGFDYFLFEPRELDPPEFEPRELEPSEFESRVFEPRESREIFPDSTAEITDFSRSFSG